MTQHSSNSTPRSDVSAATKVVSPNLSQEKEFQELLNSSSKMAEMRSRSYSAGLWSKVIGLAIVSMLPILAIGTVFYYLGSQSITETSLKNRRPEEQSLAESNAVEQQKTQLLRSLLIGTGATAFCTGVIVAYLARRSLRSTMAATLPGAETETQQVMAAKIQSLTNTFQTIHRTPNQGDIFATTVTDIRKVLEVDRVIIYGLDDDLKELVIAESVGSEWPKALGNFIPDPCFQARYIEKYRNGRIKAIENVDEAGLSPCYIEQLESLEVKALLVAPIVNGKDILGLLIAHHCSGPRVWQPFEIHWFQQIATQVGFAFGKVQLQQENTHLQQQAIVQFQWMQFFTTTVQRLRAAQGSGGIYQVAVQDIRHFLDIDRVIVYGLDGQSRETVIAESVGPNWPAALDALIPDPCFQARYIEKYRNGRIKAIDNIYEAGLSPCYIEQLAALKVKALIVAPIVSQGNLIGLLIGHQCYSARAWQDFEVQGFSQIATQVGFALDQVNAAPDEMSSDRQEQDACQVSDWD